MIIDHEDFFKSNLQNDELVNKIRTTLETADERLVPVTSDGKGGVHPESRHIDGIDLTTTTYVGKGLEDIIKLVNNNKWKLDLENQWSHITALVYRKEGHHFRWHVDGKFYDINLSVVLCLSHADEYEGGLFEIETQNKKIKSYKLDFGDFVVFPSKVAPHRVTPLESGTRRSIVGFYK